MLGYVAATLVVTAFYMRDIVPLRVTALCSNLAFIAYGLALGLAPIWLLHALLLPVNGYRLFQELRVRAQPRGALSITTRRGWAPRNFSLRSTSGGVVHTRGTHLHRLADPSAADDR